MTRTSFLDAIHFPLAYHKEHASGISKERVYECAENLVSFGRHFEILTDTLKEKEVHVVEKKDETDWKMTAAKVVCICTGIFLIALCVKLYFRSQHTFVIKPTDVTNKDKTLQDVSTNIIDKPLAPKTSSDPSNPIVPTPPPKRTTPNPTITTPPTKEPIPVSILEQASTPEERFEIVKNELIKEKYCVNYNSYKKNFPEEFKLNAQNLMQSTKYSFRKVIQSDLKDLHEQELALLSQQTSGPIHSSPETPITVQSASPIPQASSQGPSTPLPPAPTAPAKPLEEESEISEPEWQKEVTISQETNSKIQACMESILQYKKSDGLKFYGCRDVHRVFELDTAPGLIFKMEVKNPNSHYFSDYSMKSRYQKIINAQTVVRTHKLVLLAIPNTKLFTVTVNGKEYEIIAERKVDIDHEKEQEKHYEEYADSLNEAIRQLAIFICKTGYSDVEWRNNPVLNHSLDKNGNRKLVLIDIEDTNGVAQGLCGDSDNASRGLIRCVTEKQGKMVKKIAEENHVVFSNPTSCASALAERKTEIADNIKLKQYYTDKKITVGDEPVVVDESTIKFSEHPEKAEEFKEITKELVQRINSDISHSKKTVIKERRYIEVSTNYGLLREAHRQLIDPGVDAVETARAFKTDEDYFEATHLGYVVRKLVGVGAIFKLVNRDMNHGYYLQV